MAQTKVQLIESTSLASNAGLNSKADLVGGELSESQLPDIAVVEYLGNAADQAAMLALSGQKGDWCIRDDDGKVYIITGTDPTQISSWTALSYPTAPPSIPSGVITMWSGAINAIPTGWVLCDGTNNTPNLVDRFIVGAGSTYAVDSTGGSADAVVVSHSHSVTDPGHEHYVDENWQSYGWSGPLDLRLRASFAGNWTGGSYVYKAGTNSQTTGITIASQGSSGTNANLPPYLALAYIMKT